MDVLWRFILFELCVVGCWLPVAFACGGDLEGRPGGWRAGPRRPLLVAAEDRWD